MPWEKQFDSEAALEAAMKAFWARGYEATSMQDLTERMGINRASLYATFGNKHSLFLAALRRYDQHHRAEYLAGLAARHTPKAAILTTFDNVIHEATENGARDGCLLVNTALELSPHDPKIAAVVGQALSEVEVFFRERVAAGQATGEIPAHLDAAETARALLGLFMGLRVLTRSRPEPALLRAIARQAEALLG
ncbi:MAG: TetR/AcrR family transcriptional regulator [Pseudomonadota bacterium]